MFRSSALTAEIVAKQLRAFSAGFPEIAGEKAIPLRLPLSVARTGLELACKQNPLVGRGIRATGLDEYRDAQSHHHQRGSCDQSGPQPAGRNALSGMTLAFQRRDQTVAGGGEYAIVVGTVAAVRKMFDKFPTLPGPDTTGGELGQRFARWT